MIVPFFSSLSYAMECPVCFEDYSVAYAMSCGHLCCTACVGSLNGSCHTCRSVFHYENLKKIFFPSPTTIAEGVRKRLHNQEERNKVLVKQVECMTSQREKTHDTLEKIKNDANNLKNERHQFEEH
ncbi:hypothetical protein BDQ17DRAFT_686088 [Cyathus striatus]|nr:hypothetical protein BDQ17DRAFT_686088 [Cyathus striatus]